MASFAEYVQQQQGGTQTNNPFAQLQASSPVTASVVQQPAKVPFSERKGLVQTIFAAPLNIGKTLARFSPEAKALKQSELRAQNLAEQIKNSDLSKRTKQIAANMLDDIPAFDKVLPPRSAKEIIGDVIGTALFVVPAGAGIKGATKLATLARGAVYGGSFAGADALSDNAGMKDVFKAIATGAVIGAPLELGGVLAVKGAKNIFSKVFQHAADKNPRLFMSLGARLERDFGDEGKEIAERFLTADRNQLLKAGQEMDQLHRAGLFDLDDQQALQLMDSLEGRIKVPQSLERIYKVVDDLRTRVGKEAQEMGVMVRLKKGVEVPFKPRENYFPHMAPSTRRLTDERVRQQVISNAIRVGKFKDIAEAEKVLDSFLEFQATGKKGEYWANWLVKDGQAKTQEQALGMTTLYFKKSRIGKVGQLEKAREINFPFFNPDPREVLPIYLMGATRRLTEIPQLGHNFEEIEKLVGKIRLNQGPQVSDEIRLLIKKLRGAVDTTAKRDQAYAYVRALQVPKLTFAAISNAGQTLNTLLQSDFKSVAKGVMYSFTEEGKRRALQSGATLENILREAERATGVSGETRLQGLADKWLRVTGFQAVERMNRTVAANAGFSYAQSTFLKLQRNPTNKIFQARLQELGIDPAEALARNTLSEQELLLASQKMTELTQFRNRPLDLPEFMQSPEGKLIGQFKTFSYNQAKFLKNRLASQLRTQNYKGLARDLLVLGTVFPMAGEVIGDVKSLVTGSKRPTKGLDRYINNFMQIGGLGIISDAIVSANHGYLAQFFLGPSVSSGIEAAERVVQDFNRRKIIPGDIKFLLNQTGLGRTISNYAFPKDKKEQATFLQTLNEVFNEY